MAKANKNWVKSLSEAINMATTVAASVALGYFGASGWTPSLIPNLG